MAAFAGVAGVAAAGGVLGATGLANGSTHPTWEKPKGSSSAGHKLFGISPLSAIKRATGKMGPHVFENGGAGNISSGGLPANQVQNKAGAAEKAVDNAGMRWRDQLTGTAAGTSYF